jgi:uncharacterized protein (TIGR03118 family)
MLHIPFRRRQLRMSIGLALTFLLYLSMLPVLPTRAMSIRPQPQDIREANVPVIPPGSAYRQTNLISDVPGLAPLLDPLLVNPWGITFSGTSPFWISNNGSSTTQLVRGDVAGSPLVLNPSPQTVNIPDFPDGNPTGVVPNSTSDFQITPPGGGAAAKSLFIFDSLTGNIVAWNGASGTTAQKIRSKPGNVYTGLAIGSNSGGNRLYAADFKNNHIDVFDGTFTDTTVTGNFIDATIPAGYNPFNVQNLGGSLFVTYGKVGTDGKVENGAGQGFVRKFNTDGVRDLTFAINNGALDGPWGLTIAPASFGIFGGALLVGNFSDNGTINAYNPSTGAPLGTLKNEANQNIVIPQLWGLQFGNGGNGGDVNTLYFTAGIGEEDHGLFGKLNPTTAQATSLVQFATDDFAIGENSGHIDISVIRAGDASGTATVNYATFDESQVGHASQKSDYEIAAGTLTFLPGETAKTIRVLVVDDKFVEGNEQIQVVLSNPTGTGVGLGSPNTTTLNILDDDTVAPTTNPIDAASFFVRQHYLDFLNREPDPAGLAFWTNEITSCGGNAQCIEIKRINVSAAFFQSIEFKNTGLLAYLTHRTAFGTSASGSPAPVLFGDFERDTQALQNNFAFGLPGADAILEANKVAYFNDFVTRPEFVNKYPSTLTDAQYVDALLTTANLTPAEVRLYVVSLTNSQEVPPTNPTTSGGVARPASNGTARFQFNSAQTSMTFTATINNIDVGGTQTPGDTNDNLIAAHIHASPTVVPGVNGPVVWGFFGSPFNDNNPNDAVVQPFTSGVGGVFSGKWDPPEGNGTTLAAQLTSLTTGHAYINFHTTQFGGGEIRGNFPAADAFRNALVAGLGAATETRASVLRKIAESDELQTRELNNAFVTMEYFGYLRRDPDTSGFNFWLNKLNAFNGNFINAEMVKAFITSGEFRQRFGPN